LKGKTVLPGFTDCHVHISGFGRSLFTLNLRNVTSIAELKEIVKEKTESLSRKHGYSAEDRIKKKSLKNVYLQDGI